MAFINRQIRFIRLINYRIDEIQTAIYPHKHIIGRGIKYVVLSIRIIPSSSAESNQQSFSIAHSFNLAIWVPLQVVVPASFYWFIRKDMYFPLGQPFRIKIQFVSWHITQLVHYFLKTNLIVIYYLLYDSLKYPLVQIETVAHLIWFSTPYISNYTCG